MPRLERIEATTGRQMSQPRPVPCAAMISLNVRSPVTRTMSKSWARLTAKCSQSALLTSTPDFSSSVVISFLTSGRQEPQRRAGLAARLHAREVGAALLGDGAPDRAGR